MLVLWRHFLLFKKYPEFVKSRFYQGAFTKDEWAILKAANDWVQEKISDGLITFVNFNSFSMDKAIRLIKTMTVKKGIKYLPLIEGGIQEGGVTRVRTRQNDG